VTSPAGEPAPQAPKPGEAETASADPQVERGRELYTRICAVCHGAAGEGYAADAAPALNHQEFLRSVSDALLREAIANGRKGSTMSAWSRRHGGPLEDAEIEALIALLRSWQKGPMRVLDESPLPRDFKQARERGRALYDQHCARCHGKTGVEGPNARVGDRAFHSRATTGFLRHAILVGRAPTPMRGYAEQLGAAAVDDVITHLRMLSLEHPPPQPRAEPKQHPLPLAKLPSNPRGKPPRGFKKHPQVTPLDVIARELKRGRRMALLDARAPSDYLREHIAGAASVPYYDPSPYFDDLPKDTWLVAYCACPHAESKTLAQKLIEAGFEQVTVLDEGIGAWKAKGHPVASAPREEPPEAEPSPK
jgi:cytochrome c oxidase cbb3-type subunit 3/ubiquinol-cytochrome c reductase cytochrome c subunit